MDHKKFQSYFYQAYLLFHCSTRTGFQPLRIVGLSRRGITFLQESEYSGIFNRTSNRALN